MRGGADDEDLCNSIEGSGYMDDAGSVPAFSMVSGAEMPLVAASEMEIDNDPAGLAEEDINKPSAAADKVTDAGPCGPTEATAATAHLHVVHLPPCAPSEDSLPPCGVRSGDLDAAPAARAAGRVSPRPDARRPPCQAIGSVPDKAAAAAASSSRLHQEDATALRDVDGDGPGDVVSRYHRFGDLLDNPELYAKYVARATHR